MGLSANRKGWCLFDPKTRKVTTSYHVTFNESMDNRVCALRDFDLRPSKAGAGASLSEERFATLERALYDANADLDFDSEDSGEPDQRAPAPEVHHEDSGRPKGPTKPARAQKEAQVKETDVDSASNDDRDHEVGVGKTTHARPRIRGSSLGDSPKGVAIPSRRAAIGSVQELDEDDFDFLKLAFELDLPMVMEQRNPKSKSSASRIRYKKYKPAKCLRDVKMLSGSWADITWDYSRGYIDFGPTAASSAAVAALVEVREARPISDSAASNVTCDDVVQVQDFFSVMSYEESVQQDYAMMAIDHLESMSHRAQQLLKRALGGQTLTEYAHCCASLIMVPDPLSVKEAMASEHAKEWKAAMQEEIDTLDKFHCFDFVPRAEALSHGRLVKSRSLNLTAPFNVSKVVSLQRVSLSSLEPISLRRILLCFHTPASEPCFLWLRTRISC